MIVNVPTSEALNHSALRLYFSAWATLIDIRYDFDESFSGDHDWTREREEYIAACQPDLQAACSTIQQYNELALKARICEVSPYLLLIRNDQKFSLAPKKIDFADLRTLDAVELPAAVNSFTANPLSAQYVQAYNEVRSLRNKITHLGALDRVFQPDDLLRLMVGQYIELWPERAWLNDRLRYASETRSSFFHDGKYSTAEMVVMHELSDNFGFFTSAEFKALFGRSKQTRRYRCHACVYEASTRFSSEDKGNWKTAYVTDDKKRITCVMCLRQFPIVKKACHVPECKGAYISADEEHIDTCHSCGGHPDDDPPSDEVIIKEVSL